MNKIFSLIVLIVLSLFATSAFADVPDCNHDRDPVDTKRYRKDIRTGKVASTSTVPVGTVWETNSGSGHWTVCRTTKERKIALLKDGQTYYDTACGNEVRIATPPIAVRPGQPNLQECRDCATSQVTVPVGDVIVEDLPPQEIEQVQKVIVRVRREVVVIEEPVYVQGGLSQTQVVYQPAPNPCCQPGGYRPQPMPQSNGCQAVGGCIPGRPQVHQPMYQQPAQYPLQQGGFTQVNEQVHLGGGGISCTASINGQFAQDFGPQPSREACDAVKEQWAAQMGLTRR